MKRLTRFLRHVLLAAALLVLALGCDEKDPYVVSDGGMGEGDACASSVECRGSLVCSGHGTCKKLGEDGTGGVGKRCATYVDCQRDFNCNTAKWSCDMPGKGAAGGVCKGHQDCAKGLVCSSGLECAKLGALGAKASGATCDKNTDCVLGLVCVGQKCASPTFWAGRTCAADAGTFRALFEIPRSKKKLTEFYRLPWPIDIRIKNGRVDVTGHPDPGPSLPAQYKDVVKNFYAAINKDVTGFGLNTAVLMRMSHSFDLNSLTLIGLNPTVQFLNIDKKSPGYGKGVGMSMFATTARGRYICQNVIALRPNIGSPLLPSTTYAVLLRRGIKTKAGKEAEPDTDFSLMLKPGEPMASEEKIAWQAYKPLRDYITDKSVNQKTLIGAAVFTTMDPRARASRLRAQVQAKMATPKISGMVICDGKMTSPCDDAKLKTHACPKTPSSYFHELQGSIEMPVMQRGTRPYKKVDDLGYIEYDNDGKPVIQEKEKLCVSITIPKGAQMPAGGWPVVVYAHGTGGHFRSFILNRTAELLSEVKDTTGGTDKTAFAVISIDAPLHGRRSKNTDKPEDLFFNLQNPRASRDNVLQGAADKFQLMRLLKDFSVDDKTSPTGKAITFDPKNIYYLGHSQGTVEGLPFLAFEPDVRGAVLSGAGGYMIGSLLEKTKPRNIAGQIKLIMADPYLGSTHPLLNMLQLFFEEVDGLNYAGAIFRSPATGMEPKHVFMSKGVADGYTPTSTTDALVWAMGMRKVKQDAQRCGDGKCTGAETCQSCKSDCGSCSTSAYCGDGKCGSKETCRNCPNDCPACPLIFPTDNPPVKGNIYKSTTNKYTAGMVEYASDGTYDDHQVLFRNPAAKIQWSHFLGSAVWDKDGVPTIPKKN